MCVMTTPVSKGLNGIQTETEWSTLMLAMIATIMVRTANFDLLSSETSQSLARVERHVADDASKNGR